MIRTFDLTRSMQEEEEEEFDIKARLSQVIQRNVSCRNGDPDEDEGDEEDEGTCGKKQDILIVLPVSEA